MRQAWNIARKEFSDGLRNRWMLFITLLFALLAGDFLGFGAAASGQVGFTNLPATIALYPALPPFNALNCAAFIYDAIVGEDEGGTLMLLLTYPLTRRDILWGNS